MQKHDTWLLNGTCEACGAAVVVVACNAEMHTHRDASSFDYWMYCSSKACKNHDGNGIYSGEAPRFRET